MQRKKKSNIKTSNPNNFIKWRWKRLFKSKDLSYRVPVIENSSLDHIISPKKQCQITWFGHCTFLIQINGLNIITDPVWSKYMGVEKRLTENTIFPEDLPQIDVVLISHNHYDHLNFKTLKRLNGNPAYMLPKRLGDLFKKKSLYNIQEFEWWNNDRLNDVSITFVPAQHWSKRGIFDTNKSLWGGWVISDLKNDKSIYFSGDTGYFEEFSKIGNKFDIEYALLPIGCYEPEWFMSYQHMSPEDSVRAFKDLNARYFVPMHYDSYRLADDTPRDAIDRLFTAWKDNKLPNDNLKVLKIEETL
ncbi:putative Zn-dependent hydrolase [Gottschalkia purinilytica]|uniref:Putative Zn-dependent hydrolase n=1 Tax=Gottschalkia purinilytica TaxID=1503 RepID=A0A0L0WEY7_GOTPU|nr:MBL fold metallo-hydrolase [Gottschalkia purinilytica]KNF10047.1 putative Zn-dependent hydrolase [Gottschalkia purinilytica]